jgi:hypothetical protein
VIRVFHDRDAADHFSRLQNMPACRPNHVLEAEPPRVRVILLRAGEFPEADRHHLHQAAFELAAERRVPFHATNDHHGVGCMRRGVHEHFDAIARLPKRDHFETTDDGAAHRLFVMPNRARTSACPSGVAAP